MPYDLDKLRPLEIALLVHDVEKGEGRTERELLPRSRIGADAFFLIRSLIDDGELAIHYTSSDAKGKALDLQSLWHMWVCMTGHLAREAEQRHNGPMLRFCSMVLAHMGLNIDMTSFKSPEVPNEVQDASRNPNSDA